MTVEDALRIDRDLDLIPVDDWRQLKELDRARFLRFTNEWLTAKTLLSFPHFLWYGVYWNARKHYRGAIFLRMAEWMQTWRGKIKFLLVAREYTKSQMAMAYEAWRLTQDQNRRLLIRAYNTEPKAVQIVRGIREILDSPAYRKRYPWVTPKLKRDSKQKELWGNNGLMLERPDVGVRVPSVEVCGMEKEPTGGHFTDGLNDDFAIKENETSDQLQPKIFEIFQEDDNLFLAGAQRITCGTIWAKDGFMDSVKNHEKIFADMDYDLFFQPGEIIAFPAPFSGAEAELSEDRRTFRVHDVQLPAGLDDLRWHQARLTFENPAEDDTEVVIREVVSSNAREFRVNRPIENVYTGKPLHWYVGNTRPAAPTRFTMDCVDHIRRPEERNDYPDRSSLYLKRKNQGPYTYGCNVLLDPLAKECLMFNSDLVQWISRKDFDELHEKESGVWYRKCDFSSAKHTGSNTAIVTGWVSFHGVFVRRIFWGLPKTDEILLELFRGQLWLKEHYKASLRHTQVEKAHIENTIEEHLRTAQLNPYSYFSLFKQHKAYAERTFRDMGPIKIQLHVVSRGMSSKMDRIRDNLDPVLEQERLYIVEDIPHADRALKEITEATADNDIGVDLVEVISDLCAEIRPPKREEVPEVQTGLYDEYNRRAVVEADMARYATPGYP